MGCCPEPCRGPARQPASQGLFGPSLAMRKIVSYLFLSEFPGVWEGRLWDLLVHILLFTLSGPHTMLVKPHLADNARGA